MKKFFLLFLLTVAVSLTATTALEAGMTSKSKLCYDYYVDDTSGEVIVIAVPCPW